jgi:hypothetical protein
MAYLTNAPGDVMARLEEKTLRVETKAA